MISCHFMAVRYLAKIRRSRKCFEQQLRVGLGLTGQIMPELIVGVVILKLNFYLSLR
jgi:hypothetical protein